MEFDSVKSSNVAAIGYDSNESVLGVRFTNGSEYHYVGVPKSLYQGLISADSIGKFFNERIKKGGFSFHQIR